MTPSLPPEVLVEIKAATKKFVRAFVEVTTRLDSKPLTELDFLGAYLVNLEHHNPELLNALLANEDDAWQYFGFILVAFESVQERVGEMAKVE